MKTQKKILNQNKKNKSIDIIIDIMIPYDTGKQI